MIMTNQKNIDTEEFKYLIDSRNLTKSEKKEEAAALLQARQERYIKRSENEMKAAKLTQLKYQIEEYLNQMECSEESSFPKFLSIYVDILYEKRKNFASDINIAPIALSQIINKHREPGDSFLYRLTLHSQIAYKEICAFDSDFWIKVYYRDKVCQLLVSSGDWRKAEKKYVKGKVVKLK
jgi:hypothetical protein